MPESTQRTRGRVVLAVAACAAVGGYIAGGAGVPSALADGRPRDRGPFIPGYGAPPAVAVEKGGFAVVGGADSRYYVVGYDGTSCVVRVGRSNRDHLHWR